MAGRNESEPWSDRWVKKPWKDTGAPDDFSRRKTPGKANTIAQVMGIGLGFGVVLHWYDRVRARAEEETNQRYEFKRKQNELWRQQEERAAARGSGQFDNVKRNEEGFWEEKPRQRAAGASSARPLDRTQMNPWQQARYDAAQDIRYTLGSEAEWKADPKGMAENARYRAEALGEPLDPRAARYFAERGLPALGATSAPEAGPVATRSFGGVGAPANPNAVEVGPGIDIEGMKRAGIPATGASRAGGFAGRALRFAGRAAGPLSALAVGWSLKEKIDEMDGTGPGGLVGEVAAGVAKTAWEMVPVSATERRVAETAFRRVFGGSEPSPSGSAPSEGGASADPTEEEIRAQYSEDAPDERAPSGAGGVPVDFKPAINPNAGRYRNAGGWGESAPKPKRGKPFKDPHGIGQARLQAEHEIDQQSEADRRAQREEDQNARKASSYIAFIETQDRKQARAQAASAKRFDADERAFWWSAQLEQWEQQRLEGRGSRRHHRSITVNSWQAAGATVGGFAQINVDLVRSEIERSLERGDTEIRMN